MEENKMLEIIRKKAEEGNLDAKIAIAINKVKYEGKIEEGLEELLKLSDESEVACHNLIRLINALKNEQYYNITIEKCKKLVNEEKEMSLIDFGAIYQLGILGIKKDIEKAIGFFNKAIELYKSGIAYQSIGAIYYYGKDVEQDMEKAFKYFKLGADTNYADSEDAIAQMYLNGQYVERDYNKTIYWYEKAFEHGKKQVAICIGNLYLPENNILNDEEKALEWYSKGGKVGVPECLTMEGYILENGSDNVKNLTKAIECYERAASLGNPNAYFLLGMVYMDGNIVTKNTLKARENLEKALNLGIEEARYFLEKLNRTQMTALTYEEDTSVGAYLPETTITGMQQVKQDAIKRENERRLRNRDTLMAAASINGRSGFIDDKIGCYIDEKGNEIFVDSDSGYIFNDTTGDISFYDKRTNSVYNTAKKEFSYLYMQDGYAYNFDTGKTTIISGNVVVGE